MKKRKGGGVGTVTNYKQLKSHDIQQECMIFNLILDWDKNSSKGHYWLNLENLNMDFLFYIIINVTLIGCDHGSWVCGYVGEHHFVLWR